MYIILFFFLVDQLEFFVGRGGGGGGCGDFSAFGVVIMESRRRQKCDNFRQDIPGRRSQFKRPPRGSWQPTVPSWEKEFCKVVGSLDWEKLLQMKKFVHLYENVVKWNDSAGEEAFCNAKNRFWAQINGLPCNITLPDPDLYIDEVNWDSNSDLELLLDLESKPAIPNTMENNEAVVIFGDSLIPNQEFSPTGWGDDEENVKVPANSFSANNGDSWEYNWDNSFNNGATVAWSGFCNNAWHFSNGGGHAGYIPWGGGWDSSWVWSYANNNVHYEVGPESFVDNRVYEEQGKRNYSNFPRVDAGRCVSSYRMSGAKRTDHYINHLSKNDKGRYKATNWGEQCSINKRTPSREWNSFNSCVPVSQQTGITAGQTWNKEKPVS